MENAQLRCEKYKFSHQQSRRMPPGNDSDEALLVGEEDGANMEEATRQ